MLVLLLKNLQNKFFYNLKKVFCKKKGKFSSRIYTLLGVSLGNETIYHEALSHKSLFKEKKYGHYFNNERLEFLGDSIFNTVISDILYKKFPTNNEGFLSNTRSKIVRRCTLDKIAYQLRFDKLIFANAKISLSNTHIMGNALEAFIGAIYLDKGYKKTKKFIEKSIISPFINIDSLAQKEIDFKSKLFEWSQKNKISLEIQTLKNLTKKNQNLIFQTQILLNGVLIGIGLGSSKKKSQQLASKMSLEKLSRI